MTPSLAARLARPLTRPLGSPRRALAARWQQWWEARSPRSDSMLLTHRNVYILPTRAGLVYVGVLIVLLVASINYQLGLGYGLTFLLTGSGIASMHLTHGTLRGLSLQLRPPAAVHAGDAVALVVVLSNPSGARHGIGLRVGAAGRPGDVGDPTHWVDVEALGQSTAHLACPALARGWQDTPVLHLETRFPLGLFRAWAVWRPAARVLVYPRAEPSPPPLPALPAHGDAALQGRHSDSGDTEGVRAWRRGDALRLVAWKKVARSGELVSRDTRAVIARQCRLDFAECAIAGTEGRLSRLAAWVLAADRAGVTYALRLPGVEVPAGSGDAHRRLCLERLALWA